MPDPIDLRDVNTGFQNERESLTDFTKGYPIGSSGAIVGRAKVAVGQSDIHDGMFVTLNSAGDAIKYYSSDEFPTQTLTTVGANLGKLDLTTAAASTVTFQDAVGDINLDNLGIRVGDTIATTGGVNEFSILITGINGTVVTFDNTVAAPAGTVVQDDATPYTTALDQDFQEDANNHATKVLALTRARNNFGKQYLAADTYQTFNGAFVQSSKKITLLETNYEFKTAQLQTGDFTDLTFVDNNHPIKENLEPIVVASGTLDVTTDTAVEITINGYDFAANGVVAGDTFTLIAPSGTGQIQTPQTFTIDVVATVTLTFDGTVAASLVLAQGDGTVYTTTTDGDFGNDILNFLGGEITFNRPNADIVKGKALTCNAGLIALPAGAANEEIVGHVVNTDPLLRLITVAPHNYKIKALS